MKVECLIFGGVVVLAASIGPNNPTFQGETSSTLQNREICLTEQCEVAMASSFPKRAFARSLHHLPRRKIPIRQQCLFQKRSAATYTSPHQAAQISIIQSAVDTNSERYRENASSMGERTKQLTTLHAETAKGGPEKARKRHTDRGKMLVRDRITALIDPGTSFLELSALAGYELYPGEDVTGGAMVTGVGTVEGVMCVIIANDATYVLTRSLSDSR